MSMEITITVQMVVYHWLNTLEMGRKNVGKTSKPKPRARSLRYND